MLIWFEFNTISIIFILLIYHLYFLDLKYNSLFEFNYNLNFYLFMFFKLFIKKDFYSLD